MNSLVMRAEQRQTQTLSPRLQHAVRLLQMSSLDFAALVRDKLGSNPFLEIDENDHDGEGGGLSADAASAESLMSAALPDLDARESAQRMDDAGLADASTNDGSDGTSDGQDNDRDFWNADDHRRPRGDGGGDGGLGVTDSMAAPTTLPEHLRQQLALLPLSQRDLGLAMVIAESLDDDGYLRTSLDELLPLLELETAVAMPELEAALACVQQLDPVGVGARSVAECLRLQLPLIECPAQRALAQTIVVEHLQALASRDVAALATRLRQSPERIEAVCDRIRRLDPRPGWRHSATHAAYVVPDVVVKRVQGRWQAQLNPAVVPRVRLNEVYAELFARHRDAQHGDMAEHLQEAKWTVRNVEQRFCTILDVAQAIVKRQRHFLEFGAMAMKPLGLREIADEVGVHESTVSRVTNNKYMATPLGVFELKYFFSRSMVSANGSECSGTAIRSLVKDIIDSESPQAPLSDVAIAEQLSQQGLHVARRTVTKYRHMLKLESVGRRRRLG